MKILIIISLFLCLFARPAFAEENLVIIDIIPPDQDIIIGQTFPINVTVETNIINRTFYYLFYGGVGNTTSYIQTQGEDGPILSFEDDPYDWENIPTFTTDFFGNYDLQSNYAYINPNTPPGIYSLYLKIFLPELYSDDINDSFVSEPQLITVIPYSSVTITPTSTPTPIPTINSTNTPVPSLTPTLTPTPTISSSSNNQIPTLTPTPTINISIFGTSTASATLITPESTESSDLITQDPNLPLIETGSNPVEIKETKTPKKSNLLPFIILGSGVVFLTIPLILIKINKK